MQRLMQLVSTRFLYDLSNKDIKFIWNMDMERSDICLKTKICSLHKASDATVSETQEINNL